MPHYNMIQHFDAAYDVIEDARTSGGRAFVHCEIGVNRSGTLAVAYVMVHKGWDPITAAKFVKEKRKWLLSNVSFQRQLIDFACSRNLLAFDDEKESA
jgi:protein-tyrosine phosphatase